ncbi:MAG: 23S rRNA (guanosine(2251)-2'-O)-methyltransferase RlmB, partial [Actinomycetota bacterium]|nr:23S rRNA (guanosine(2251)-2'-O)-methyltransferase RlmB [Actinomycetota bacterium]
GRAGRPGRPPRGQRDSAEMVAGRNAVVEALRVGVPATALYVAARIDSDDRVREAFKLAADSGVPLLEAPRPELDRLASGALHQGLALQLPPYGYAHPDDLVDPDSELPLLVALDGVTDPRNLGAVIRSAHAFGGHGVLVPERRAAGVTAATWKASAGAVAHVPVARATNLTRTLEDYKKKAGLFLVGLDADGDAQIDELVLATEPLVLVIGSEGRGLSRLVAQSCDVVARIPMPGGGESLNAGVAAGIALYEVARQRRRPVASPPR